MMKKAETRLRVSAFFMIGVLPLVGTDPDALLPGVLNQLIPELGWATEMSRSARSHVLQPTRFTPPYSVTM